MITTPTPHNERVEEILGRLRGASWYMSKEGKKGYFIDDETLTAHITSAITTYTTECEARGREQFLDYLIDHPGLNLEKVKAYLQALTPPTV